MRVNVPRQWLISVLTYRAGAPRSSLLYGRTSWARRRQRWTNSPLAGRLAHGAPVARAAPRARYGFATHNRHLRVRLRAAYSAMLPSHYLLAPPVLPTRHPFRGVPAQNIICINNNGRNLALCAVYSIVLTALFIYEQTAICRRRLLLRSSLLPYCRRCCAERYLFRGPRRALICGV